VVGLGLTDRQTSHCCPFILKIEEDRYEQYWFKLPLVFLGGVVVARLAAYPASLVRDIVAGGVETEGEVRHSIYLNEKIADRFPRQMRECAF
jgi:hypothetical protein